MFLAGREHEIRRFRALLQAAPELPANVRITGLRGVGKSVLLKRLEDIATREEGWLTSRVQVEPRLTLAERTNRAWEAAGLLDLLAGLDL